MSRMLTRKTGEAWGRSGRGVVRGVTLSGGKRYAILDDVERHETCHYPVKDNERYDEESGKIVEA